MMHNRNSGFTLLELLISLTIVAVILVIVFGAFRIGVRAWEKGEKNLETQQRYRSVLNLMQHQLASAYIPDKRNKSESAVRFRGDNKSLALLSHISLVPGNKFGTVYAEYRVTSEKGDRESLSVYEKNVVLLSEDFSEEGVSDDDFYMLIPDMALFEFEYLKEMPSEEEGGEELLWQPAWDPENDSGYPLAIRIRYQADDISAPVQVIVPFPKETEE